MSFAFKGIANPKNLNGLTLRPSKIRMSLSSSDLEKCSIASLAQQWMLCSEWVPSEWESDKNITIIIHTTPVHQLMSSEDKSCVYHGLEGSLQSIHWWASDVKLYFFKSDEDKLIYILDGLRVRTFSVNVNVWLNYSFRQMSEICFEKRDRCLGRLQLSDE